MYAVLAVLVAAAAGTLAVESRPGAARLCRLQRAPARRSPVGLPARQHRPDANILGSRRSRSASALLIGCGGGWIVGGFTGVVTAILLAAVAWVGLGRLEPAAVVRARAATARIIPLVADLLAAAVAAGSPPVVAVEVVADAVGGPISTRLRSAAAATRVGVDPAAAWTTLADDPALRPLARALAATAARGTSPLPVLKRLAQDARDTARWEAESRARSVGARAAAPLGLCFLPAFVLVGIVPVIATAGPFLP